jgi:hypothetical protein
MARMRPIPILVCAVGVGLAAVAFAQSREFTGRIEAIGPATIVVNNGKGDVLRFSRSPGVKVFDARLGKSDAATWAGLSVGDWVSVRWVLSDEPRKAYQVILLAPRGGMETPR